MHETRLHVSSSNMPAQKHRTAAAFLHKIQNKPAGFYHNFRVCWEFGASKEHCVGKVVSFRKDTGTKPATWVWKVRYEDDIDTEDNEEEYNAEQLAERLAFGCREGIGIYGPSPSDCMKRALTTVMADD